MSGKIKVTKGLRQGCCIVPTLFKIYLEGVLENWKKKCEPTGIRNDDYKLYTLHIADDQEIVAEDTTDAHCMLRKLDEEYTRGGLTINPSKTEYLVVGNVGESLELQDTEIKSTGSYKCLSVKITDDGCNTQEIASRIG